MQKKILTILIGATFTHTTAWADDNVEQRLQYLEQRLQQLEQTVQQQAQTIQVKEQEIKALQQTTTAATTATQTTDKWSDKIEISGIVEVAAQHNKPYSGESSNDISVATVELGLTAQVNPWIKGEIVLLYEEDDTPLDVDVATLRIAPPDAPWYILAGRSVVPFGTFASNMISDSLPLEIGETSETALQLGFEQAGFSGAAYLFNGDNKKAGVNKIDNWGVHLGYAMERNELSLTTNLGFINDIGEGGLQDTIAATLGNNDVTDHVAGWFASGLLKYSNFSLIGEYLGATDNFQVTEVAWKDQGAEPHTWQLEAAYDFAIAQHDSTLAIGYQGSDEALAHGLPQNRWLLSWSIGAWDNTQLSFEWAHDEDYGVEGGGTGQSADALTAQIAVEF